MLTLCHNYFNVTPSNKSSKDAGQPIDKKRYLFGLFLLFVVDVLWVVSSEVTKYIYTDIKLERPFLITYVRSSLLFVYLVVLCFSPPTRDPCRPADYTQLLEPTAETDDENFYNESGTSLGDSTFVPVRAGETDSDDAAPRAVRFNKVAEVRVMSAAQAGEALLARLSWAASVRACEHAQRRAAAAATRRHLRLAVVFAVPWFISNYLYRLSLLHTSTTVATVCLSSTGVFALALGAVFARAPGDRLTAVRVAAGVAIGGAIVILTTLGPSDDCAAVLAALGAAGCYALHLALLRRELRKAEGINSPLLAGLVGCFCLAGGWALGGALAAAGGERAPLPPPALASWLLLDAALGPPLLDALWLWGYSLTSAQTATWSLCAVIPLPLLAEAWRGTVDYSTVVAVILATIGWVLAAADHTSSEHWMDCVAARWRNRGFTAIRNIPELDEQSEALMSSDEPT
ncbi:solute carrier family 35 member F5 [Plutella xylostella]|uniref:solute carrier family 35 member F5 n=1 Tax=Plutella xylostella TaxID=51655 RepID=UPI00203235A1|nr:solute carrier family 35 member F5 [Plutella xylostella]